MREKPALRPSEPVGPALTAIAHEIIGEGRAALTTDGGNAAAVHDYRKAMKRWRAYLRLIEPFLPAKDAKLRIEARDLARALAPARDLQAALDALADLEEAGLSATSLKTMRGRIEAAQQATETALSPLRRSELQEALAKATRAVDAWTLDNLVFGDLAGALTRHYRRARRARPEAWENAAAEDLHRLRRRVVEHRYQMELVEPAWPRLGRLWVAEAQRLRERLGSYQDLVVLGRLTAPHEPLAPWRSRLLQPIEARQAVHAASARRLADRLFAERPGAFRRRIEALWESRAEQTHSEHR